MLGPARGIVRIPALAVPLALLCLLLGVPAALALKADPVQPVVGETVTFTEELLHECTPFERTWTVDGQPQPGQSQPTFEYAFATPGEHTVSVATRECASQAQSESVTVTVSRELSGSVTVRPDPPAPGQTVTLEATQTGGIAGYGYAWDIDDDGAFDDATTRIATTSFPTTGQRTVRVRIRDSATPAHEAIVTRAVDVQDPPPPATTPTPTPTPPPCLQNVAFGLSEFTTEGCFTQTSVKSGATPDRWETRSAVRLNGVLFPDFGQTFTITGPTDAEPGGRFTAPDSTVQIENFTAFSGDIDWTLPAGVQGEEGVVTTFAVPPLAELFGLRVRGSTELRLGLDAAGEHYAVFPFKVELPAIFKPAPDPSSGSVTAVAPVRVDSSGPRYDGLKLQAMDVWLGRIRVPELCFSHIPSSGQSIEPCPAPTLDGEPYLTCATTTGTERFDGNAILELPVESKLRYAAFGGLIDGQLANLGGFTDDFAAAGVQLVPGVFLNRLGAGVCLNPPPLQVRGDVGAEALDGKLLIHGRFVYTDADSPRPWKVLIGGNTSIAGRELGDGSATFNAWGDVDFALRTDLNLFGIASLNGSATGWLEPRNDLFNVTGTLDGCLVSVVCAKALGLISSTGVAGCVDAGNLVFYEPAGASQGPFGFGSITVSLRKVVIPLRAGFGHRYGTSSVDLLGNSCDFSAYSATRSSRWARIAAGQPLTERIAPGTKAVALRIHGSDGPPKVVVRGPGGVTITSPKDAAGKQSKGRYILAENTTDGTTSVLLVKPRAGEWTVRAAPGATSKPTRLDRSDFEGPATFVGRTRLTKKGRDLVVGYTAPAGAKVTLAERGKGVAQTIAANVKGKPCRGVERLPSGEKLLCKRLTFKPSRGPGGTRRIDAVVTRGGIPLSRERVVSFEVPKETLPARPGKLRARRVGGDVVVGFGKVAGASRYSVIATISDGRRIGFDLAAKCRAVRIPAVPGDAGVDVRVAGVRYDLATGKYRRVILAKGRTTAGPSGRVKGRVCT